MQFHPFAKPVYRGILPHPPCHCVCQFKPCQIQLSSLSASQSMHRHSIIKLSWNIKLYRSGRLYICTNHFRVLVYDAREYMNNISLKLSCNAMQRKNKAFLRILNRSSYNKCIDSFRSLRFSKIFILNTCQTTEVIDVFR